MSQELEPNTTLAHYRIVSKLGAGGMGEVYLAQDSKLDRKVALKILPPQFAEDRDRMARFIREAKSASALNHPNIITIYEIGENEGTHFIATEFIDGQTLNAYAKSNPLQLKTVLEMAIQIASALDEAHSAGIVHRDLKPDNLMVRANGLVKILDFGIAKLSTQPAVTAGLGADEDAETALKAQSTSPGMIIGTASYMSPEQAKGKEVDARTDIFSFGVVLYELIASGPPFEGATPIEILAAIIHKDMKPLPADVPAEITRIIQKCLQKERTERYQTIRDVLNDLKDVKDDLDSQRNFKPTITHDDEGGTQILEATTLDEIKQNTNPTVQGQPTRRYLTIALVAVLLLASGFFGYRYFRPASNQIESIAVMPFVNEGGNQDIEYLSDGMTETLISSLSQIPNLSVKARSTVFFYKGKETTPKKIGEELGVQAVLLGRVAQRGDDLRLSLELVDAQTQDVLWSDTYNRKQSELVSLQSEIAREVSTKLKSKLSGTDVAKVEKKYTDNAEAYQLYLKGKYYWNKRTGESLQQAAELYRQAIEKDSNYALAYSGLAETYVLFSSYDVSPASDSMPQAKAAALRALAIDDSLAEAHTALGFYLSFYEWDRAGADKEFRRAIELKPSYATAHHWFSASLATVKRFDESIAECKLAENLDPLSPIITTNLADTLVQARRYDEAIAEYKRTLLRNPNFAYAHRALGWAYGLSGRYAEAIAETRKAIELDRATSAKGYLGLWLAKSGKRDEALKLLSDLKQESTQKYVQSYTIALIYIGLGDKDEALNWLEKEMSGHSELSSNFGIAPELDFLRSEPRFNEMLKRMNL